MHASPRGDDGFTLIEILVAMSILGIVVVTFYSVMTSLMVASEHHRGLGATDTVVRDYGEAIKKQAITASTYTLCPTTSDLTPSGFSAAGFTTSVDEVEYWIPATGNPLAGTFTTDRDDCLDHFNGLCDDCDPGYQRVQLTVIAQNDAFRGGRTTTQILLRRGNTT